MIINRDIRNIFIKIIKLKPREVLIFNSSVILKSMKGKALRKLNIKWLKIRVRRRLTEDREKSILII